MKSNSCLAALVVLLLASNRALVAGDTAGNAAPSASPSDIAFISLSDDDAAAADQESTAPADAAAEAATDAAADTRAESTTPLWQNNPSLNWEPLPAHNWLATRFGWWAVGTNGSKALVGEWQGLQESSAFFDVDGLTSDGTRSANFWVTGPESEATMAGLQFYNGPGLAFDVDYRRFLHRLGVTPIGGPALPNGFAPEGGFYNPPLPNNTPGFVMYGSNYPPGNTGVVGADLINAGDDYAIRVQQFEADVKGRITDNLSWRINFWGLKKEGTRQANTQQHCFGTPAPGGRSCHVMTQGQNIDWVTAQVEPAIAWQSEAFSIEYSRTMRSFQQDDQLVLGDYRAAVAAYGLGAIGANNWVSENYTEIDRVKMWSQLAQNTDLYVLGWVGNTHNRFRESDRKFYGVDARVTNQSIDGLSATVYGKTHVQNNSADTQSLNSRYPGDPNWLEPRPPQQMYTPADNYLGLADRHWTAVGIKNRWRPFYDSYGVAKGFAVVGGYEWAQIERKNVTYNLDNLVPFTQPTTVSNMVFVGVQEDWSSALSSFLRYRFTANSWPIVGVTERHQLSLDAAINSNQPEYVGQVELGGTWNVADDFMLTGTFWIENSYNHSEYVNFSETAYPYVLSAWYTPHQQWSFVAGYANLTNWITQDITLGREDGVGATPGELIAFTAPWNFTGRSDVINLAASFAATERLSLMTQAEYVRAENFFLVPPSPPTANPPYTDLPGYSAVVNDIYRITAGVDYLIRPRINAFVRYNIYD
ncbi:MAG: hypothetical protein MUF48_13985, partial [Pirellulaceae bacterium]|nr:hypothetical protein [Pirellulaceae bacterium]